MNAYNDIQSINFKLSTLIIQHRIMIRQFYYWTSDVNMISKWFSDTVLQLSYSRVNL